MEEAKLEAVGLKDTTALSWRDATCWAWALEEQE
jgi:hypothetical protein